MVAKSRYGFCWGSPEGVTAIASKGPWVAERNGKVSQDEDQQQTGRNLKGERGSGSVDGLSMSMRIDDCSGRGKVKRCAWPEDGTNQ